MNDNVLKNAIIEALAKLDRDGDIVITTSTPNVVVNTIFEAIQSVSPNLLSTDEFSAILNATNLTWSGFYVDDSEFETYVGLTREQLGEAIRKLVKPN